MKKKLFILTGIILFVAGIWGAISIKNIEYDFYSKESIFLEKEVVSNGQNSIDDNIAFPQENQSNCKLYKIIELCVNYDFKFEELSDTKITLDVRNLETDEKTIIHELQQTNMGHGEGGLNDIRLNNYGINQRTNEYLISFQEGTKGYGYGELIYKNFNPETGIIQEPKVWSDYLKKSYEKTEYINEEYGYSFEYPSFFEERRLDNFNLVTSEFDDNSSIHLYFDNIGMSATSQLDVVGEAYGEDYSSRFDYQGWVGEKKLIENSDEGRVDCLEGLINKEGAFNCEIKKIGDKKFLFKYTCPAYKCAGMLPQYITYHNDYRYTLSGGFLHNTRGWGFEVINKTTISNVSKIKVIEDMLYTLKFSEPLKKAVNITDEKFISFIQNNGFYLAEYHNNWQLGERDENSENPRFIYLDKYNNEHVTEYSDSGLEIKITRKDAKTGEVRETILNEENVSNEYSIKNVFVSSCCQLVEIKGVNKKDPKKTYFFGRGI
jgi:hypothetical protein